MTERRKYNRCEPKGYRGYITSNRECGFEVCNVSREGMCVKFCRDVDVEPGQKYKLGIYAGYSFVGEVIWYNIDTRRAGFKINSQAYKTFYDNIVKKG